MKASTKTSIQALCFTAAITFATLTRHSSPFSYNLLLFVTALTLLINLGAVAYMAWHNMAPFLTAPAWARWTQFYVMCVLIGYLTGHNEHLLAFSFFLIACSDLMLVKSQP